MKKLIALLIALLIVGSFAMAYASDTNWDEYSTDDLITMRNEINAVLNERMSMEGMIYTGKYVAGVDIKPGEYVITVLEKYEGLYYVKIDYADENKAKYSEYFTNVGTTVSIILSEGDVLTLEGGNASIIRQVKQDWMM